MNGMGQESSSPISESLPPQTLQSRTLRGIASHIRAGRAKKIIVLAGAGISTSAGIPDFRSPGTGLYANLARLKLPYAEAVFDISFFRERPEPFYTLAKELYPGRYRPTITHSFFKLLHDKGLLLKVFTQNIDCLEREAGLPDDAVIEAHGSFAGQGCIDCGTKYDGVRMRRHVNDGSIPRCDKCKGLVKPNIVFFGEQLPEVFHANRSLPDEADLCIVLGTSLTVQPFASLPGFCREGVPRLLINKEQVGGLGSRADDVLLLGDCDDGVIKLADACGWKDELVALWSTTARPGEESMSATLELSRNERDLEAEVKKLTKEVDETLKISKDHVARTQSEENTSRPGIGLPLRDASRSDQGSTLDSATTLSHVFPHLIDKY